MNKEKIRKSPAATAALLGILSAEAIAVSVLESMIPVSGFLPPGAKLGLSNIVTMFAAVSLGLPETLCIVLIKSAFVGLTRGLNAFFMSAAGGILSALVMFLLLRLRNTRFGYIGISVCAAVAHNAGQLAAASVLTGVNMFVSYGPVLLLLGIAAGVLTGTVLKVIMPVLEKQNRIFYK